MMDEKTRMGAGLKADKTEIQDGGLVIPFRRPVRASRGPTVKIDTAATTVSALPAHDDPAFEALHRKAVQAYLRAEFERRALQRDPPEKTPG